MSTNIYPTRPGFGLRVHRARNALRTYARNGTEPYSRGFDNCFEMSDGDAVVWQLMRYVIEGDNTLEQGIRQLGSRVFADWMNVYDPSNHDRAQRYFEFLGQPKPAPS